MNAIGPANFSQQKGLSLIGLMIGLLISVLCILGSLTLYKNLIQVATESKLDSNHDGQLASAMLVIQLEVQSAGYGINNAGAAHIIEHDPSSTDGERQLLWRFTTDNGATYQCRGLHEQKEEQGLIRKLSLIRVNAGCNSTAALNTFTWTPVDVLGRWRVVDDGVVDVGLDDYVGDFDTMFDFILANTTMCNPYGAAGAAGNRLLLTVRAPGSAFLQGAAGMTATDYQYCLPNIYPAASP